MIFCVVFLWLKFQTHPSFLHNLKMANKLNYPLFCIKGGMRLVYAAHTRTMSSALRLAWIPRLLRGGHQNWKSVPYHFFDKYGGLQFILNCNYDVKYFAKLPNFYKEILKYFSDLS